MKSLNWLELDCTALSKKISSKVALLWKNTECVESRTTYEVMRKNMEQSLRKKHDNENFTF